MKEKHPNIDDFMEKSAKVLEEFEKEAKYFAEKTGIKREIYIRKK